VTSGEDVEIAVSCMYSTSAVLTGYFKEDVDSRYCNNGTQCETSWRRETREKKKFLSEGIVQITL